MIFGQMEIFEQIETRMNKRPPGGYESANNWKDEKKFSLEIADLCIEQNRFP